MKVYVVHRYIAGVEAKATTRKGDFDPPEGDQFEELSDLQIEESSASRALQIARELTAEDLGGNCDGIGFQIKNPD